MAKTTRKQYVSADHSFEQQNRASITEDFRNVQPGNYHDLRRFIKPNWSSEAVDVFNIIVDIVQRLTQPRPAPGNQNKRELDKHNDAVEVPENTPSLSLDQESEDLYKNPEIKPMLKKLQQKRQKLESNELTEVQRAVANTFGAYLPGAIPRIVQNFIGNLSISYDPQGHNDQALGNGSHIAGEIGADKNFKLRGIQEGGVSVEVEASDERDGLIGNPSSPNPLKTKPTPFE